MENQSVDLGVNLMLELKIGLLEKPIRSQIGKTYLLDMLCLSVLFLIEPFDHIECVLCVYLTLGLTVILEMQPAN